MGESEMQKRRQKESGFLNPKLIETFFNQAWAEELVPQADCDVAPVLLRMAFKYTRWFRSQGFSVPKMFEQELTEELHQEIRRLWRARVYTAKNGNMLQAPQKSIRRRGGKKDVIRRDQRKGNVTP
jgi:hypothetical protein